MYQLQEVQEFNERIKEGRHVVLFSADWCIDCVFIKPFIDEVAEEFNQFTWTYVDRDKFMDICTEQGVMGIPSFIAYENGNRIGDFISTKRKTREEIETFLKSL